MCFESSDERSMAGFESAVKSLRTARDSQLEFCFCGFQGFQIYFKNSILEMLILPLRGLLGISLSATSTTAAPGKVCAKLLALPAQ
jgi:hypothetical protein